jgi:hypothetical protein
MNMQALLIRATVIVIMCLGLSVALLNRHAVIQRPASSSPSSLTVTAPHPNAQHAAVMLPTIKVRPTAAEFATAAMSGAGQARMTQASTDTTTTHFIDGAVVPALPNLRLDMPYYSFGKVMSRGNKE